MTFDNNIKKKNKTKPEMGIYIKSTVKLVTREMNIYTGVYNKLFLVFEREGQRRRQRTVVAA